MKAAFFPVLNVHSPSGALQYTTIGSHFPAAEWRDMQCTGDHHACAQCRLYHNGSSKTSWYCITNVLSLLPMILKDW